MGAHTVIIPAMAKKEMTVAELVKKAGKARWEKMSPEERAEAVSRMNAARWKDRTPEQRQAETEAARVARKKKARKRK
jgi:hypothetical protein